MEIERENDEVIHSEIQQRNQNQLVKLLGDTCKDFAKLQLDVVPILWMAAVLLLVVTGNRVGWLQNYGNYWSRNDPSQQSFAAPVS